MLKLSKKSIRWCLFVGFTISACMTLITGAGAVIALNQIKNKMEESVSVQQTHKAQQTQHLSAISTTNILLGNIKDAKNKSDLNLIREKIDGLDDTISSSSDSNDVGSNQLFTDLVNAKQKEIEANDQLHALNKELQEIFAKLDSDIALTVENISFDSMMAVERGMEKTKAALSSTAEDKSNVDFDLVSTNVANALTRLNAIMTIQSLGYQLNTFYKNVLLTDDDSYVQIAEKSADDIYERITVKLRELPDNRTGNIYNLVNATKKAAAGLFSAKTNSLNAKLEQETKNIEISNIIHQSNTKILDDVDRIGKITDRNLSKTSAIVKQWTAILLTASIIAVGIASIVGAAVSKLFSTNIAGILKNVDVISSGDLTLELDDNSTNEFGKLAKGINAMVRNLRDILLETQHAAAKITASGSEILAASEQQAAGTRQQSAAVSETTAAAEELSKTSEHIGDNIKTVSEMTMHVLQGMEDIKNATNQTNEILTSLNDKSKQIGYITELIDDIADQTNLLAVNASIEAARAGEQGRGFTVVADQISKLADSTAKSTKDITALIEEIQNDMSNAIIAMENSLAGVDKEIGLAGNAAEKSKEIAMSANQQINGSTQIADAMGNIDDTMKQITSSAELSATSVKELASLADGLKEHMSHFRVTNDV